MSYDPSTGVIEVSTATGTKGAAVELARLAVGAKLAAGAQITGPVTSVFWHLGELGMGEEWRVVLRTQTSCFDKLRLLLVANHPWQKPEVLAVSVAFASDDYAQWVRASTMPDGS